MPLHNKMKRHIPDLLSITTLQILLAQSLKMQEARGFGVISQLSQNFATHRVALELLRSSSLSRRY